MDRAMRDRALPHAQRWDEHLHSHSRSPSAVHHHALRPPLLHVQPRSPLRDPRTRDQRLHPPSSDRDQPIHHHHHHTHTHQQHHRPYHEHSLVHPPHAAPAPPPLPAPLARRTWDDTSNSTEPRYRNDPAYREKVMRTEVVPLHEFKRLRALKIKVDKTGGGVVPIPVPLESGETEREYEEALHEWLRGRGVFLSDLRDDPLRERAYRNSYANMRAATVYNPQTRVERRSREYSTGEREGGGEDGGESHVRKRSGSLEDHDRPPSKVHVKAHPHSSSSNNHSSTRDHRYDDASPRPRHSRQPVSPTRSPRDSSGSTKRCKAQLPASSASFQSFVSAYVKCYCFDCLRDWNLMLSERLELLETEVRDLRKRVPEEGKAVGEKASAKDRSPKVEKTRSSDPRAEAKINGENQEKPTSETAKVKTSTAPKPSSTPTRTRLPSEGKCRTQDSGEHRESCAAVARSERSSASDEVPGEAAPQSNDPSSQPELSSEPTPAKTSLTAVRQTEANDVASAPTTETALALATPDQMPVAAAIESHGDLGNAEPSAECQSQNNRDQAETAHAEVLPEAAPAIVDSDAEALAIERSVKAQMIEEYDSLNKQILIHERVVQDAVEQIQRKMVTDMAGALREQEQIHQLRQSIFEEMRNRDAALAMVIAYYWVGKHAELMSRITQLDALDVPHVQRVGHVKCAELATRIAEAISQLSTLKVAPNGGTVNSQDAEGLKSRIALAEVALATLEEERTEQFMRLFQFSNRIRALCKSMLEEKG